MACARHDRVCCDNKEVSNVGEIAATGDGLPNGWVAPKPKKKKRKRGDRRSDWQANQAVIGQAWLDHYKAVGRGPSLRELARVTGLAFNTVRVHVEELDISRLVATSTTRAAAGKILEKFTERVMADPKGAEVKDWFKIHGLKFEGETEGDGGTAQTQTFKAYGGFDIDKV